MESDKNKSEAREARAEELVQDVLREVFGFSSLRAGQEAVIRDLLRGENVISVMPTGAGKSLCYQLPAAVLSREDQGLSLVVSPLIALMKDQVDTLQSLGVRASALTSAASADEQSDVLDGIRTGEIDIVYVAPERFYSGRFRDALASLRRPLALMAIDEAHCISEWGHDFRPAYRALGKAIADLSPARLLAATATATPEVREDICEQLGMRDPRFHVRGFARPTLCFVVEHVGGVKDKAKKIVALVHERRGQSIMIYAATRKNAESYAEALRSEGIGASAYHAGLADAERTEIQDEFMNGDIDVIVATNAFGMGVDKADVRLVVHADIPRSVEAYYQEAGRAGRDGKPATCLLLFNHGDVRLQEFLINASCPSAELLRALWKTVNEVPGVFAEGIDATSLPGEPHASTVAAAVRILLHHGYLQEQARGLYAQNPPKGQYPDFDPHASERRAQVERSNLQKMIEYAYSGLCRHHFVLDYFGDPEASSQCENCDNCLGQGQGRDLAEDEVRAAQILVEIVGALGGRFGRKRITGIANGSDSDPRFYELPNYGALADYSQGALMDLLRALEAGRIVAQNAGEYPTIALTQTGKKIARGKAQLDPDLLRVVKRRSKSNTSGPRAKPIVGEVDTKIAERLRQMRSEIAARKSVPAYVIFSNRTLDELSIRKPATLEELAGIHGIGPSRVEQYGSEILAAVLASK